MFSHRALSQQLFCVPTLDDKACSRFQLDLTHSTETHAALQWKLGPTTMQVELLTETISASPFPLFDAQWYRASNPELSPHLADFEHYLSEGWAMLKSPHPLFDIEYYLRNRPDVRDSGSEPLYHFVTRGWREGSDPHPLFSCNWYLSQNPDVAAAGVNPLIHYVLAGALEGRDPHPLFDARWYRTNSSANQSIRNPLIHYLLRGYRERLDPSPFFEGESYLRQNPDLDPEQVNPLLHYEAIGWREGRDPTCWFSTQYYLDENSLSGQGGSSPFLHFLLQGREMGRLPCHERFDPPLEQSPATKAVFREMCDALGSFPEMGQVTFQEQFRFVHGTLLKKLRLFDAEFYRSKYAITSNLDPFVHYLLIGCRAGFWPNGFFNPVEYLALNRDLLGSKLDPVLHYSLFGWKEGRNSGSHFNGNQYRTAYPDVAAANICPLSHFLAFGLAEGRRPVPTALPLSVGFEKKSNLPCPGTIVLVVHDMEVGGAQAVARTIAKWLIRSTGYDLKIVAIRGGGHQFLFEQIALVFNLEAAIESKSIEIARQEFRRFVGPDVRCILLNSIASYKFLEFWDEPTPVAAYIHELSKIIKMYDGAIDLLKKKVSIFFAGSAAVKSALCDEFDVSLEKCRVIYDFIDSDPFESVAPVTRRAEFKSAIGLDRSTLLVVACGTVNWRKSPSIFIEVARQAIENGSLVDFVWVGNGPDEKACLDLIETLGLGDRVRFVGYQQDVERWIGAADIFLLPSEEDPFPLVCLLAAAASTPIICFEGAGGIPEITKHGCGVAVPFKDASAMCDAVKIYVDDAALREEAGRIGKELINKAFTINYAGPEILYYLRKIMGSKPAVTVIVPNFNYEKYLHDRLFSIYNQTFQDFDVVLLDDNSTDGSLKMLESWAAERSNTRLVANAANSGSVFRQWKLGIGAATADIIWIAEADDFCELNFLAKILEKMQDRNVFLAYGRSFPTDSEGRIAGDYNEIYLNRIFPGRWDHSYLVTDANEISQALGIGNCIPNASSVVFRKFDFDKSISDTLSDMQLCGDWLFYLVAAKGGYVTYVHEAVNYHRRHPTTVTKKLEGSFRYFSELARVRRFIRESYNLPDEARSRSRTFLDQDMDRFSIDSSVQEKLRAEFESIENALRRPSLLVVASDLSPGGGQLFAIRLANAWAQGGGRAFLLNARHSPDHPNVVGQLGEHVALFYADSPEFNFRDFVINFEIDVIHSSIWWADKLVAQNIRELPERIAWIVSMHGCYETLLTYPAVDPTFGATIGSMLDRVDHWVFTADKNKEVFAKYGPPRTSSKVANGFMPTKISPLNRRSLGLRDGALVICLASRAIAEKGWHQAIKAVEQLNNDGRMVDLMLIGEGPVAESLKQSEPPIFIRTFGQVGNLQDYINVADIGILPSYFVGESMPLVVIEYLAQGKPVIGTDIGEIKNMLTSSSGDFAGIVVPLRAGIVAPEDLVDAVEILMDPEARRGAGENALEIYFERFSMKAMIQSYSTIYKAALEERGSITA